MSTIAELAAEDRAREAHDVAQRTQLSDLAAEWQQAFAALERDKVRPLVGPHTDHIEREHMQARIAALEQECERLCTGVGDQVWKLLQNMERRIESLTAENATLKAELAALKEPQAATPTTAPFPLRSLTARHRSGLITETPRD